MTTLEKLNSSGLSYQLDGIITCLDNRTISKEESDAMKLLRSNNSTIAGRPISLYANAVLDILGVEKYDGNDKDTLEFISAMIK